MIGTIKLVTSALFLLSLYTDCYGLAINNQDVISVKKQPDLDANSILFPNAEEVTTAPRCGGVLRTVNSTIEKSLFDPVLPNERCVWIVAAPNATSYDVEVYFGHNSSHRHLTIAGITRRSNTIAHVRPATSGRLNRISANILVIVFQSGNSTGAPTGFTLRASRAASSIGTVSSNSVYQIVESNNAAGNALLKHPVSAEGYSNNELSAFVFPPRNNLAETNVRNIIYQEVRVESGGYDYLSVNVFNAETSTFVYRGSINGGANPIAISSNDIILLLFHTDSSITYGGFYLASHFSNC